MSQCTICIPVWGILYHVITNIQRPIQMCPFDFFFNFYEQSLCRLRIFLRIILCSYISFSFQVTRDFEYQHCCDKNNNLYCVKGIMWISCIAIKHVKDIFLFINCIVKYVQVHMISYFKLKKSELIG